MQNHRFFQDNIYKLKYETSCFTDQEKKKVVLSAYNPINLCVNYFSVYKGDDADRWQFDNENHKKAVQRFLDVEKKDDFKKFLDRHAYTKPFKKYRDADLHYFLLNLYNNFPVNPSLFFDGIMKKVLLKFIQKGKVVKYAFIDALEPKGDKFRFKYFQWFDMRLFFWEDKPDDQPPMGVIANQESGKYFEYGNWFGEELRTCEEVKESKNVEMVTNDLFLEEYFFRYLLPFFNASKDKDKKTFYGDRLFPMEVKQLSEIKHFLLMPFYDSWIGIDKRPCGMIQGNLSILSVKDEFKDDENYEKRKAFIKENLNEYTDLSRSISQLLHESRTHELLKLPTQPEDDFLRDFLRKIACVQEWKSIMVFTKSGNYPKLRYCFKRFRGRKANNLLEYEKEWNICKKEKSGCEKSCLPPALTGFLKDELPNGNPVHENQKNNTYLFCIMLEDILRSRVLPSVEDMDIARYKNHILCFEFPEHTFFPRAKGGKRERVKRLGEYYIDKLIPIFDRLLLSRKVLKHSIKSAVAAIMSRNMSHNIGSHVLSYLSDEYLKNKSGEKIIYSLGFYKYLQGRSDYIAEISTTRPIWATQMRLINDVIDPFVYSDHRTKKGELLNNLGRSVYGQTDNPLDASKIKIIIRLASKKLPLKYYYDNHKYIRTCADEKGYDVVCDDLVDDPYIDPHIDMPHGLVGCHAFYSILENFLRNSFKHKRAKIIKKILNTDRRFEAHIEIDDNIKEHPDLIRVRLHDNVSDYSKRIANEIEPYINGEESQLVNKDGSLKKDGGWGIKEMRISSAWLRNISPDDAQSVDEAPALLSIGNTDDRDTQEESGKLYYEFYLLKPLLVLFVDRQCDIKEVPSAGIYKVCSKEEFVRFSKTGKLRHKFFIINDKETEKWVRDNKNKLPPRIFLVRNDPKNSGGFPSLSEEQYSKLISNISTDGYDVLGKKLYEWWVNYLCDGAMPKIYCVNEGSTLPGKVVKVEANFECDSGSIVFQHGINTDTSQQNEVAPGNPLYWEYYSTGSGANILGSKIKMVRDGSNDAIKLKTLYELYEVALANIVIVDERLFRKVGHETNIPSVSKKVNILKLLHRWNIDVINLGEGKEGGLTVYYRKSNGAIGTMTWPEYINKRNVTFLSIHQTIINEITEALFKEDIALSTEIRNVIIHSGRGTVDITPGFKFVEFSNIENSVIAKPDKHQLCSLLMSISSL